MLYYFLLKVFGNPFLYKSNLQNMTTKLLYLALITSFILSISTINVHVFATYDHGIKAKNDDGQQVIGVNECNNRQEDLNSNNNNQQILACDISANKFHNVESTENIIHSFGILKDDASLWPLEKCEECFSLSSGVLETFLKNLIGGITIMVDGQEITFESIDEICEAFFVGIIDIEDVEEILELGFPGDANSPNLDEILNCLLDL